jgi:23S rRNA pseudouridine1911/1915/1917 synthase
VTGEARSVLVPDGLVGERLDAALARLFGLSRTTAADLAARGEVTLNDRPAAKGDRVGAGDLLHVLLPRPATIAAPAVVAEPVPGMSIVHDDEDLVVVDKPAGVAAHPSVGWNGPDVLGGLAAAGYGIATSGASERRGIVSRLDVGTSGLMVVAKSEDAYSRLKRAFKTRQVAKTYQALVQGLPDPLSGSIDAPIGRHPGYDYKFAVMERGKHAVTHYEVIEAFRRAALLRLRIETGRTHQIRVHLAAIRHPCCGDPLYGCDPTLAARLGLQRQWLHATELGFEHPGTGRWVSFASPVPEDLRHAVDVVRAGS